MGEGEECRGDKVEEVKSGGVSWTEELQEEREQEPSHINSWQIQSHIFCGTGVWLCEGIATNKAWGFGEGDKRAGGQDGVLHCTPWRGSGEVDSSSEGGREGHQDQSS